MYKNCVICGKEFFTKPSKADRKCCSTKCAGIYRKTTYGCLISEETKKENAKRMKALWNRPEFRENNHKRMTENNPVYQPGVVEKTKRTILKHGGYKNYFKYGNGKMSVYEQIAWETLKEFGFEYNQAISTYSLRQKYPEKHIAFNYKPDFLHRERKICIEIDGHNHAKIPQKYLDDKKDSCLKELGYKVIRFTHEDIDNGKLGDFIKQWQN